MEAGKSLIWDSPEEKKKITGMITGIIIGSIIIFIIIASIITRSASSGQGYSVSSSQTTQTFVATDDQLIQAYSSNQVSANQEYQNKLGLISGTVYNVGQDGLGGYYVMLREGYEYNGVQCEFKSSGELTNLYTGEHVTLKGTLLGFNSGIVLVQDCSVYNS